MKKIPFSCSYKTKIFRQGFFNTVNNVSQHNVHSTLYQNTVYHNSVYQHITFYTASEYFLWNTLYCTLHKYYDTPT